jgi:hypothetical protein
MTRRNPIKAKHDARRGDTFRLKRTNTISAGHGRPEGDERGEGDGDHGPHDNELSLGKIDDAGGAVDDVESDGDDGVNAAAREPRHNILEKRLQTRHKRLSNSEWSFGFCQVKLADPHTTTPG